MEVQPSMCQGNIPDTGWYSDEISKFSFPKKRRRLYNACQIHVFITHDWVKGKCDFDNLTQTWIFANLIWWDVIDWRQSIKDRPLVNMNSFACIFPEVFVLYYYVGHNNRSFPARCGVVAFIYCTHVYMNLWETTLIVQVLVEIRLWRCHMTARLYAKYANITAVLVWETLIGPSRSYFKYKWMVTKL